jgi:hypothetical protein
MTGMMILIIHYLHGEIQERILLHNNRGELT